MAHSSGDLDIWVGIVFCGNEGITPNSEQDHIFYKNMFLHLGLAEGPFSGKAEVFLASFENIRGFNTIVGK